MLRGDSAPRAAFGANDERHGCLAAEHISILRALIRNLIGGEQSEIDVHDLDYRARAGHGRAHSRAAHRRFADRGLAHALRPEFFQQTFRRAVRAAVNADVFAHDEYAWIAFHLFAERFGNCLAVRHLPDVSIVANVAPQFGFACCVGGRRARRGVESVEQFRGGRLRRGQREFGCFFNRRFRRRFNLLVFGFGDQSGVDQFLFESQNRIAPAPLGFFLARAVGARVTARMAVPAIGARFDQSRAAAAPRAFNGLCRCVSHGGHILPIHGHAGHVVRGGAHRKIAHRRGDAHRN